MTRVVQDLRSAGLRNAGSPDPALQDKNLRNHFRRFHINRIVNPKIDYKWITSPYAAAAASITASDIVGCG